MADKSKPETSTDDDSYLSDARLSLDVGSSCLIYSRSAKKWCPGVIQKIFIEATTNKEWMTIKYGKNKSKKIQRFCKDLRVFSIKNDINNAENNCNTELKEADKWKNNILTKEEIAKHIKKTDCWIIINNIVYDVSHLLNVHPVSALFILNFAGKDASNAMRQVNHSEYAFELAKKYRIGILSKDNDDNDHSESVDHDDNNVHNKQIQISDAEDYGNLANYNKYKLIKKDGVNHNCFLFTFESNNKYKNKSLKLGPGSHWMIKTLLPSKNGQTRFVAIIRAYTPIIDNIDNDTSDDNVDYFQLLIKIYPNGKMTQYLNKLNIGDYIESRVVYNKIRYIGIGKFQISGNHYNDTLNINNINMICGGTGITPMYQIMTTIHLNKEIGDMTKVNLFYANRTYKDILLLNELNIISKNNVNIKIYHIVEQVDKNDNDNKNIKVSKIGRIDKELLQKYAFEPTKYNDTICLFCGPDPMIIGLTKYCEEMGFTQKFIQWFI